MKKPGKPAPSKAAPAKPSKPAKPFRPVPVAVQRQKHRQAVRNWKPVPVPVQRARHAKAAVAAKAGGKKRGLALGTDAACCAAEALAASLRLSGWPVSDADVLALYELTADGPDDGASIEATLDAAARFGLAGAKVQVFGPELAPDAAGCKFPCILGVELPGAHAVLATADGWWSWGELHSPDEWPGALIEEAWAVSWG